ncbi:hypothetical protein DOJK_01285 [Patescibacteria group bacterium]|nr:hypothetical protein DOJK_01285 [Patescibacteria group bacterium]
MAGRIKMKSSLSIVGGICLLILASYFGITTYTNISKGIKTEAEIIKVNTRSSLTDIGSKKKSKTRYITFKFNTQSGQSIEIETKGLSSDMVGNKLQIIYTPNNPFKAQVNSFMRLWESTFFSAIVGIGFIIFGLISRSSD